MNKKLLLLCTTLLMSIAAFAQWTKPVPASTVAFEVSEDATYHYYYLYNKDAQAFYTEGNAWGTQASIGAPALKVYFSKYLVDGAWDGKTYLINDSSINKSAWKLLFIDSENAMFVDRSNQSNYMWEVIDQGNNIYRFVGADANPEFAKSSYESCYMGFDLYDGASFEGPLNPFLNTANVIAGHTYCVDWQLVPEDAYEAIAEQHVNYYAATNLKVVIDSASVHNTDINLAGINAVYNNGASTKAELDSVKNTLNKAIDLSLYITEIATTYPTVDASEAKVVLQESNFTPSDIDSAKVTLQKAARAVDVQNALAGATEDNPKDATSLLTNPDFETGNTNGWDNTFVSGITASNCGFQNSTYTNGETTIANFIEAWAGASFNKNYSYRAIGDAQLSQTIVGLPAGKYVLAGDFIATNQDGNADPVEGVQLFATDGENDMFKNIATGNGAPEHSELTFVSEGGNITMGLRTVNTSANWIAGDNFTLTYYGETTEDPYKVVLDATIKNAEEKYPAIDNVKANAEVKTAYTKVLEAAQNAEDDYQAVNTSLTAAVKALDTSVSEYTTLQGYMEELTAKQEQFEGTIFEGVSEELNDLYMEWEEAYDDETATAEYIAGAEKQMSDIIINFITTNAKDGDEITALINNPDFDTRFSGWSHTGATPEWGGTNANTQGTLADVTLTSGNAEVYHAAFNMYQIIPNMPKGSFKLTCQAFERNDGGYVNYWTQGPEAGITATLYAGNEEAKINNILAYATEGQLFSDGTWWDDQPTDYGYIPNGMPGSNYHFYNNDKNDYLVTLYFTVPESGDSVQIGLKTTATNSWIIFDNFRLYYQGSGADAYKEQIDELTAQLNAVFNDATLYGTDAKDKVDASLKELSDAYASGSGDACMEAVATAQEALAYAKTSITDYQNLSDVYGTLAEAAETYQETADAELVNQAVTLMDQVENATLNTNLTNEEAEKLYSDATLMISALTTSAKLNEAGIDIINASEENPVDVSVVITNATFDTIGDFNGWSGTGFSADGNKSTCAEHYNKTYDTYQDLGGLPAGYYILKANAFYRRGSATTDYAIEQANPDSLLYAHLYATSSVDSVETPIAGASSAALDASQFTEQIITVSASIGTGDCSAVGDGLYIPGYMTSSNAWFLAGYYKNETPIVQVGDDGYLRIGVRKSQTKDNADWSIFDNFELVYLGTNAPTAINGVEEVNATVVEGIYNLAGQKLSAPQKGINIINGKKYIVK